MDLGATAYFSGRWPEVAVAQQQLLETAQRRSYPNIAAHVTWQQGLVAMGQGQLATAQARYEDTLAVFERMGDAEQAAAAHGLLAALNDYLGDAKVAWQHRLAAFEGLSASRSLRLKYSLLASAVPSIRLESPETALSVQNAALAVAKEWGREPAIADALAQQASILASLGREAEADQAIASAREHLVRTPDEAFRNRIEVSVLTIESDLLKHRDPQRAIAAATRAIALVQQRRDRLRVAQLNLRLAQANLILDQTAEARAALNRGLAAFNEERAASTDDRPISSLDESWQLFDAAVQLALKEKDYRSAFALADTARARSASESQRLQTLDLPAVQASLGANEALLELNQFDSELAIWVIRRDRFDVVLRAMTRRDAQQLAARQRDEIWRESAGSTAGAALFNEVVRPVAAHLTGVNRLIVVPDATFEHVSFAALWNTVNGRFLVEDFTVRVAPSASAFAAAASAAPRSGSVSEPLIVSGNTATSEASEAIAAAYEASQLLNGARATRDRFFADAAGRPIIHLSARTSINHTYPPLSRFIVSDEPGQRHSGAILGRDLAQRTLPRTGVVVLDEADSAQSARGDGTSGLARAFMIAGVPAVLGTLPGADEKAARDLMISFHREMSKGISAERALHTVQRNAIQQNGRRLGAWSALVLYGSDR
jgi:CHAT domain-containing protein